MKLPEIRRRLFEFCCTTELPISYSKHDGLMVGDPDDGQLLYNVFVRHVAGRELENGMDLYTAAARVLGERNEVDLFYALSHPERGDHFRRQSWLRRTILRDLGLEHESMV